MQEQGWFFFFFALNQVYYPGVAGNFTRRERFDLLVSACLVMIRELAEYSRIRQGRWTSRNTKTRYQCFSFPVDQKLGHGSFLFLLNDWLSLCWVVCKGLYADLLLEVPGGGDVKTKSCKGTAASLASGKKTEKWQNG